MEETAYNRIVNFKFDDKSIKDLLSHQLMPAFVEACSLNLFDTADSIRRRINSIPNLEIKTVETLLNQFENSWIEKIDVAVRRLLIGAEPFKFERKSFVKAMLLSDETKESFFSKHPMSDDDVRFCLYYCSGKRLPDSLKWIVDKQRNGFLPHSFKTFLLASINFFGNDKELGVSYATLHAEAFGLESLDMLLQISQSPKPAAFGINIPPIPKGFYEHSKILHSSALAKILSEKMAVKQDSKPRINKI